MPEHWTVLITRLICTVIFHFYAMNDVNFSCVLLKYIALHKENFKMNRLEPLVYIVLKLTVCVFVECVTNIVLLSQRTHQSCIENFFALQTLLNIDQFFYNVLPLTDKLALVAEK